MSERLIYKECGKHKQKNRTDLIQFSWNHMMRQERWEGMGESGGLSTTICTVFFMCVSGSNVQYASSSLHVFLCTGKKTIGRQWQRSEGNGWGNEVRQEFLGNDAEQNKSNMTASIWMLCCAPVEPYNGTAFRGSLCPEKITCPVSVSAVWMLKLSGAYRSNSRPPVHNNTFDLEEQC